MPSSPEDEWRERARCRGLDPDMFILDRGTSSAPGRAVCSKCPVRDECDAYAIENGETGVWGGRIHGRTKKGRKVVVLQELPDSSRPVRI